MVIWISGGSRGADSSVRHPSDAASHKMAQRFEIRLRSSERTLKLNKPIRIAVVSLLSIAWLSFWTGWAYVYSQKRPADMSPQPLRDHWDANKAAFGPEQLNWILPLLRQRACVMAEMAVRQHMRPPPDLLPVCGVEDQTEIDADLARVTVSGVALVDGTKRPFTVKLQHLPPSVSRTDFIVLSIMGMRAR